MCHDLVKRLRTPVGFQDLPFIQEEAADRIEALEAENHLLKTAGIIEVAARNPNVMEYVRHWEGRTEAAEAQLAAREWQPIETAPRDGTDVLLHGPFGNEGKQYNEVARFWGSRWTIEWMHDFHAPTHWMPLPEPPQAD